MAFLRFRKSIKIAPGLKLNISKSGVGISTGIRGARMGVNSRGSYSSVGIPGSGLYLMSYNRSKSGKSTRSTNKVVEGEATENRVHFSMPSLKTKTSTGIVWFILSDIVIFIINWLVGVVAIVLSIIIYQYYIKKQPSFIPKQQLVRGRQAYKNGDYKTAVSLLESAFVFFKDDKAIALLIASAYSQLKQFDKSISFVKEYLSAYPEDMAMRKMMAFWENETGNKNESLKILQSLPTECDDSDTLLLMSEIMVEKGLYSVAIDTLKRAPLKKKVLTPDLIEILYSLGVLYEKVNDKKRAQTVFERVYAYNNSFKDVAEKISKQI